MTSSTRRTSLPSLTIWRSPAWPQRKTPSRSITNVERQATFRSSSNTPYDLITERWTSLNNGNESLRASWKAVWQNGLSALIPRTAALRWTSFAAT